MNDDMTEHAVLILAAGNSARLGRPKQFLTIRGAPMVRHIADMALITRPSRVVVVAGTMLEGIQSCLSGLPVEIVRNMRAQTGLASSLQAGAAKLADYSGPVLILGVDQPRLQVSYLEKMLVTYRQNPGCHIASQYDDTIGIPAMIPATRLDKTRHLSGDAGLKRILLQDKEALIPISAPELAFDIDTPEALTVAMHQGWIDSYN